MKKTTTRKSTLQRDINPMTKDVRVLLMKHGLLKLNNARPAYQRNDYLGWISEPGLKQRRKKGSIKC